MDGLSLRAYSRHRGCTLAAVQRAIKDGRLSASLASDPKGRKFISDAVAADAEWKATTHATCVPIAVQERRADRMRLLAGGAADGSKYCAPDGERPESTPLADARARLDLARAELAELELAERREALIPASDIENRLVGLFRECRTKLLGIPSRVRQQDPSLTVPQVTMIETLVREALSDLAAGGDAPGVAQA